jgi:peptidoglycan/LPS O-acetylase OafA/YrhL
VSAGRRLELDAMRGVMLVWIALTHLPTAASSWVNQPFGFVGAAEGFIFLSALFTGRIYFRIAEHDGYSAMTRKLWIRTLRLYGYHALLLAFAFLVAVPIASHGDRPGLHNLLDFISPPGLSKRLQKQSCWFIGHLCSIFCRCTSSSFCSHQLQFHWRGGSDGNQFCGHLLLSGSSLSSAFEAPNTLS